jgi:hypothetical protein
MPSASEVERWPGAVMRLLLGAPRQAAGAHGAFAEAVQR